MQAGDGAAARVQQAHVVVNFRGGRDGGARVAGLVLLLDGDGRGEAVHEVDVGLLDALKELARVGGERLDVAALAFGVDGVKGERAFAGAGDAADDGHAVVRDVDVDVLEVVGARAADDDVVVRGHLDGARHAGFEAEFAVQNAVVRVRDRRDGDGHVLVACPADEVSAMGTYSAPSMAVVSVVTSSRWVCWGLGHSSSSRSSTAPMEMQLSAMLKSGQ